MSDPTQAEETGDGGSSDGDTQPEDTGARPGPPSTTERTGEEDASRNREEEPPA